ncbi:hypothetical protein [Burkholderia sp. IMCC1007]|nr:hypothetical protein [Burkholderia sp. IMCC1007]
MFEMNDAPASYAPRRAARRQAAHRAVTPCGGPLVVTGAADVPQG